ncbi:Uncharacterised protein [Mycobacteroides abscessus]|nr:Uncharacterised protein [Mycobacteroides abscessus]
MTGRVTKRCATTSATAGGTACPCHAAAAGERTTTNRRFVEYSWWAMPVKISRGGSARSS